jgi:hypothetical protein
VQAPVYQPFHKSKYFRGYTRSGSGTKSGFPGSVAIENRRPRPKQDTAIRWCWKDRGPEQVEAGSSKLIRGGQLEEMAWARLARWPGRGFDRRSPAAARCRLPARLCWSGRSARIFRQAGAAGVGLSGSNCVCPARQSPPRWTVQPGRRIDRRH